MNYQAVATDFSFARKAVSEFGKIADLNGREMKNS